MQAMDEPANQLIEETQEALEIAEVKNSAKILSKSLQNEQKVEERKKKNETLTKKNEFYYCPECLYKTKWNKNVLNAHIKKVQRKLKPWKCSDAISLYRLVTTIYQKYPVF